MAAASEQNGRNPNVVGGHQLHSAMRPLHNASASVNLFASAHGQGEMLLCPSRPMWSASPEVRNRPRAPRVRSITVLIGNKLCRLLHHPQGRAASQSPTFPSDVACGWWTIDPFAHVHLPF